MVELEVFIHPLCTIFRKPVANVEFDADRVSFDRYTGAPYFSAMASARLGVYLFTCTIHAILTDALPGCDLVCSSILC